MPVPSAPAVPEAPLSWGGPTELASPSDFVFDQPSTPQFETFGFDAPSAPPPPPPGFGPMGGQAPPPPPGFAAEMAGANGIDRPGMDVTGKVPAIGSMAPDPAPSLVPPPPPGFGPSAEARSDVPPPPPAGFGQARPLHASEVYGDIADVTSLVMAQPEPRQSQQDHDEMELLGTGTDEVSYGQVPPVTPDFFARSAGKGRH